MHFPKTFAFLRNWITCGLTIFILLQVVGTNVTELSDDALRIGNDTESSTFEIYKDTSTSFTSLTPQISTAESNVLFSTENAVTLEDSESILNSTELSNATTVTTTEITDFQTSISSTEQVTVGPIFSTTFKENATSTTTSSTSIEPTSEITNTTSSSTTETEYPISTSIRGNMSTTYSLNTANITTTLPPTSDFPAEQLSQISTQLVQTEYQLNIITGVYLGIAFLLATIVICNCVAIRSIKRSLSENLSNVDENKKRLREYPNAGFDKTSPILSHSNNNGGSTEDYLRFPYIGSQNPATGRSIYNNFPVPQNRFNYLNPNNQAAPPSTAHPNSRRNREFYDAYHHEWNSASN